MYVNVGEAFTMPSLSDTFRSVSRRYTAVSGKNLKPEEGWNYEIGYKRINKKDDWKVDVFYMDFKNFFQWQPDAKWSTFGARKWREIPQRGHRSRIW